MSTEAFKQEKRRANTSGVVFGLLYWEFCFERKEIGTIILQLSGSSLTTCLLHPSANELQDCYHSQRASTAMLELAPSVAVECTTARKLDGTRV